MCGAGAPELLSLAVGDLLQTPPLCPRAQRCADAPPWAPLLGLLRRHSRRSRGEVGGMDSGLGSRGAGWRCPAGKVQRKPAAPPGSACGVFPRSGPGPERSPWLCVAKPLRGEQTPATQLGKTSHPFLCTPSPAEPGPPASAPSPPSPPPLPLPSPGGQRSLRAHPRFPVAPRAPRALPPQLAGVAARSRRRRPCPSCLAIVARVPGGPRPRAAGAGREGVCRRGPEPPAAAAGRAAPPAPRAHRGVGVPGPGRAPRGCVRAEGPRSLRQGRSWAAGVGARGPEVTRRGPRGWNASPRARGVGGERRWARGSRLQAGGW